MDIVRSTDLSVVIQEHEFFSYVFYCLFWFGFENSGMSAFASAKQGLLFTDAMKKFVTTT